MLFASVALFSCSQDEEIFSCNKDVNTWVKENLSDIRQMTRKEWLELDEGVNRAAYVAFTPEQKFLFWKEKITEVLTLDWNEAEKKHLELLYETISDNPQWFTYDFLKNEEEQEKFELFTYKWFETAQNNFGWDKKLIGSMVARGNKMLNKHGVLQINNTSPTIRLKSDSETGYKPNCECSTIDDWCYSEFICKDTKNCNPVSGCGWFLIQTCDGECVPY